MQRIQRFINYLSAHVNLDYIPLNNWKAVRAQYTEPVKYDYDEETQTINVGDFLINSGTTIFLENKIVIPQEWSTDPVGLEFKVGKPGINTNHEALVSINGKPYHGIDRNRSFVTLPADKVNELNYDVKIELFNPAAQSLDRLNFQNEPAEYAPKPLEILQSQLVRTNAAVERLLYTFKVYFETARLLPDGDLEKSKIVRSLTEISKIVYNENPIKLQDDLWVRSIEDTLIDKLKGTEGYSQGKIHMVGQSHIDLAWLWPLKEAVRKCSRTFSTMSTLLDEYSEFGYAQSQPQAYAFIKEYYPDIYERVKEHISSGRWEVVGGMWVEPDLNIPSGESLVRQLLYGMQFYKDEFNVKPRIEWLPDTFGYCASLPQLLKKAGMEYFMTTKMNWNDTNQFPYDLFNWVGIDGTSILSYLNHGVNEYTHPKEIKEHWDSYKQKTEYPEQMLLYGHGDGGGGVTREMIEYVKRSQSLPGLPSAVFSTAHDFFDGIKKANPKLPTWNGDLYLELHRGTYTTHAHNKRMNRKAEILYREAEVWGSLSNDENLTTNLQDGWKKLLLNQFHDIIPGTSIPEVYEKSNEDYKEIFSIGENVKNHAIESLANQIDTTGDGIPVLIFNSLSWVRSETVNIVGGNELLELNAFDENGRLLKSDIRQLEDNQIELAVFIPDIPKLGYCTIWLKPQQATGQPSSPIFNESWETENYKIKWNSAGEICGLYDKKANREVIKEGEIANQFQLFHDKPTYWDAWDIDPQFEDQPADNPKLISVQVVDKGAIKDIIRFEWKLSNSSIKQDIFFYHHSQRIDFKTNVEWKEDHKLLKVAFPVDVITNKATYEIPFGAIERANHSNTTWERAQFEVCGHRFADLSEGKYGVSLLNDCKYGYDVKGNVLRLSLLRAPKWPDPNADQGSHTFTYSLYPHIGNWVDGGVVKQGYELNNPVLAYITNEHSGSLNSKQSFIEVTSDHVVLDTCKPSEDGKGLILRFYESSGSKEEVNISFHIPVDTVEETNLLEEEAVVLPIKNNTLTTVFKPFEVKTIRIISKK
ncbi:alpha-mannosidase [Halalkalibacter kiskunsagensis]|uniref:Alpha-mannosidase n=1 Tax=Halalkalibacter kiskunsagensis TaxID=1548599 RepID=A0ABV6KB84_9BACI